MTALLARLQGDQVGARKAQDKPLTLLLGTLLSELKYREIELQRDLTDPDVVEVLRKAIKRRREAAEMFDKGARADLSAIEKTECAAIEKYLPAAPPDDEIRSAVRAAIAAGAANVGAVMGKVMPQFKGRAEGGQINAMAREELAKSAAPPSAPPA